MTLFIKKYFTYVIAAFIAFTTPIHDLLGAVGALVICDLVTGIYAAYKRKENITSSKMKASIPKLIFYQISIILGFTMQMVFIDDLPIAKMIAGVIAMVEFKSFMENVSYITGIDFKDVLKKVLKSKEEIINTDKKTP